MARTNIDIDIDIDIDEAACRRVMDRFSLASTTDAVNLALQSLVAEPMSEDEALVMQGRDGTAISTSWKPLGSCDVAR